MTFCRDYCGTCAACRAAMQECEQLDQTLASLSPEDADSLTRRDDDDPRTFALDHKGRP